MYQRSMIFLACAFFAISIAPHWSLAQVFDEQFSAWPTLLKTEGTLLVCDEVASIASAGGLEQLSEGKTVSIVDFGKSPQALVDQYQSLFDKTEFLTLNDAMERTDALPFLVLAQSTSANLSTEQREASVTLARRVLNAQGVVALAGDFASTCGRLCLASNDKHPSVGTGCSLVPDCVVKTNYEDNRDRSRLLSVLASHPRTVGIGLERDTVFALSGRKAFVAGDGSATLLLMADSTHPITSKTIRRSTGRRQSPKQWLVDLTQWRRRAIDRTLEPFPPEVPPTPSVDAGTLFIVGGGGLPENLMDQFIEKAGGKEKAKLVYIPCAEEDEVASEQRTVESWKRSGVKDATFIHTKDRKVANEDESFYSPLIDATGVWFGGGRQWNFADSYYGTKTHELMKQVLARGGVIGGSSAGASIQARYLARATPIQNFDIMAPGYERGGLGFIGGVAIDQHFSQRKRQKDMTQLVDRYPQLLGIGIDEATAIIVEKSIAKVVGKGKVHFYDRSQPVIPGNPDYLTAEEGQEFDLASRRIVQVQSTTRPN